ncbi:MAG: carboxypeptidase-like regulatory domain-containing protein, partial [Bacteroidetes bacterium]
MFPARSQGIRGEIRDLNGEPVPYAAIFIKELTRGTTCNALGKFSLPLPEGSYTIFFRSLGYTEVTRTLEVGPEYTDLVIELPPQTYMIPEVRVSASGEDPAYWIMRKTIGLANYHLHEVLKYEAEIYIKGSA